MHTFWAYMYLLRLVKHDCNCFLPVVSTSVQLEMVNNDSLVNAEKEKTCNTKLRKHLLPHRLQMTSCPVNVRIHNNNSTLIQRLKTDSDHGRFVPFHRAVLTSARNLCLQHNKENNQTFTSENIARFTKPYEITLYYLSLLS